MMRRQCCAYSTIWPRISLTWPVQITAHLLLDAHGWPDQQNTEDLLICLGFLHAFLALQHQLHIYAAHVLSINAVCINIT